MCWALCVVLWFTCCLLLLLSFLQSILVIHSTWKPPLQPTELKDHQHFRCLKHGDSRVLHGNSPYQPVGEAIVEVFSSTSRCQSRDAGGRWMSVATHLGHPGNMGFGGSRPGWCELIGALSGSLKTAALPPLEVAHDFKHGQKCLSMRCFPTECCHPCSETVPI